MTHLKHTSRLGAVLQLRGLLLTGAFISLIGAGALVAGDESEEEPPPPPVPFAVINAASVDRLMEDAEYVAEASGRPELMDWLAGGLSYISDLDGVDRTRPFGALFYLDAGLPPIPFPVMYVPVEDERRLLDTMSIRGTQWTKSGTSDSHYEMVDPPHMKLRFADGYAFLVRRGEWILDEDIPDPITFNEQLTNRHDIAASLRIGAVPEGIRQVFLGFLRSSTQTELQQRDEEPDASYRIRKANGVSMLELLEQLLTQGDEIRIGWDASREKRTGVLEIVLNAQPDSDYAERLKNMAGSPTMFHALASDQQPLTLIGSWKLDKREQTAMQEYVLAARETIEQHLVEQEQPTDSLAGMADSLTATIENGQMDVCLQFVAPEPEKFVIRGAVKLAGARTFGTSLGQFLMQMQSNPDVGQIDVNYAEHQGIMIHRVSDKDGQADEGENRMFGGNPSLLVGTGTRAIWFAIGTDVALPSLQQAIDLVQETASQPPPSTAGAAPIQLISRMNGWLQIPPEDRGDRGPRPFRMMAEEAFAGEDDALRVDVRPTETGVRVRIQLDEGFLRLLGMAIGRQYDRSQL